MVRIFKKVWVVVVLFVLSIYSLPAQDLQTAIKLYKSEQFAASSSAFKKLIIQSPDNGDIYYYYGVSFLKNYQSDTLNNSFAEMADSAKTVFELGANKDPKNPFNFVGLGGISLLRHDVIQANPFFAKANSLLPSKGNKSIVMTPQRHSLVLLNMAEFYIMASLYDTAQVFSLLRKAEQLDSKNPDLYIVEGDAYIFMMNDGFKSN